VRAGRLRAWEVRRRRREEVTLASRQRALALVRRYGYNATSFQTLEEGYRYFFRGEGCVAYVDTGAAWVVAGAPIAHESAIREVLLEFLAAARAARRRACLFATEQRLLTLAGDALVSLRIGEQPVWDPTRWSEILARRRSLREQLRRARAKGVQVRAVTPSELASGATREGIERVAERWLKARGMAPLDFLVRLELFSFPDERRCFVAEQGGRVVGVAGVVPVPARSGWFIEDLVRDPSAPNGTVELLIDAVMRWASGAGSRWLTLGLAPLAGEVSPLLRAARSGGGALYDFDGLRSYKAKLDPQEWLPIFLSYPPGQSGWRSLLDALWAFTQTGFLSFGLRTLARGPVAVVRVLAALLVPWTLLLALAPAERWFGAPLLKWSWVAFDVVVACGLFRFLHKRSTTSLTPLAVLVTLDAALTGLQAVLWNLPRAGSALDYSIIAVACAAPLLASVVLWGALRVRLTPAG
jgi:phosphatidylglycerol lysyltransferase